MERPTKLDKLLWLLEEVRIADKFIEDNGPEDMGYVHTAKNYIQERACLLYTSDAADES